MTESRNGSTSVDSTDMVFNGASAPQRPKAGDHLDFVPYDKPSGYHIVHNRATGKYLRMRDREFEFLQSLDGTQSVKELSQGFQNWFPDGGVEARLARFSKLRLLEGSEDTLLDKSNGGSWVKAGDKTAIQLSLVNPDQGLNRVLPLVNFVVGPPGRLLTIPIMFIGVLVLILHHDIMLAAANTPIDPQVVLVLFAGTMLTILLHECAHAATVKYYGGRVTRMGVMLFYLLPAFFCDTSDSWRFQNRWHRVAVAFAGIYLQFFVSAFAVIAFAVVESSGYDAWAGPLALFALLNTLACFWNVIPFVKLDGYWILANVVNIPNLKPKSISYLTSWVKLMLTGTRQPAWHPRHPFLCLLFGLGSVLFAQVLIFVALLHYQEMLLEFGWVGAALWLTLVSAVVSSPIIALLKFSRWASSQGTGALIRYLALVAAFGFLTTLGAGQVKLPVKVAGSYEIIDYNASGKPADIVAYVAPEEASLLQHGDNIRLQGRSFFVPHSLGVGTVAVSEPSSARVMSPVPSVPIEVQNKVAKVEQVLFKVEQVRAVSTADMPQTGPMTVSTESRPFLSWFYTSYLRPAFVKIGVFE